jgi:hypothetical protein
MVASASASALPFGGRFRHAKGKAAVTGYIEAAPGKHRYHVAQVGHAVVGSATVKNCLASIAAKPMRRSSPSAPATQTIGLEIRWMS